jgi:hypothetical protein
MRAFRAVVNVTFVLDDDIAKKRNITDVPIHGLLWDTIATTDEISEGLIKIISGDVKDLMPIALPNNDKNAGVCHGCGKTGSMKSKSITGMTLCELCDGFVIPISEVRRRRSPFGPQQKKGK